MLKFETLFIKLINQPKFLSTFFFGGVLCFFPILHIFAFGYLYLFTNNLIRQGAFAYPEWSDLSDVFIKGLELTVIVVSILAIPLIAFKGFDLVLVAIGLDALSKLFLGILFVMTFPILISAVYLYQSRRQLQSLLNLSLILKMSASFLKSNALVLVTGYGLFQLLLPLYGFSIFTSMFFLLSYGVVFFSYQDQEYN